MLTIKWALKKKSPRQYSLSKSNIRNIDYFTIIAKSEEGDAFDFLIEDISDKVFIGKTFHNDNYSVDSELPIDKVDNAELVFWRAYRTIQGKYSSVTALWMGELSFKFQRAAANEAFRQLVYNRTTKFRSDRIQILHELVDLTVSQNSQNQPFQMFENGRTSLHWFQEVYGSAVFLHPKHEKEFAKFDLIIASLVSSGELDKINGKISVSGAALATIAKHEEEERRHADSVRLNRTLAFLTFLIAMAALIELFVD